MVLVSGFSLLSGCAKSSQPQNPPVNSAQPTAGDLSDNPNDPIPALGGYADAVNCEQIAGWAWSRNQPYAAVQVDIYDGDKTLITVPASDFREDLVTANLGNGRHAFSYSVPADLKDRKPHTIHIRVSGGGPELRLSPKTLNCEIQDQAATTVQPNGFLDEISCNSISGWAWNRQQPDAPVKVDIYDGENKLVTVTAADFREDLLKANLGNGRHAFNYPVVTSLKDGKPHAIHVRVSGADAELNLSPHTLDCK